MSSRQMGVVIALLAGLLLFVFGLGVTVGLLQPAGAAGARGALTVPAPPAEPEPVPRPTATPRGETAPLVNATPTAAATSELPAPSPSPELIPSPTAPPLPTPTSIPTALPAPSPSSTPTVAPAAGRARSWVQVGSLSQAAQAEALKRRTVAMGFAPSQVVILRAADGRFRVRVGPFPDDESASRVLARLRTQGLPDAFLVRE